MDVTFVENDSYFSEPYLQRERQLQEDKEEDSFESAPAFFEHIPDTLPLPV